MHFFSLALLIFLILAHFHSHKPVFKNLSFCNYLWVFFLNYSFTRYSIKPFSKIKTYLILQGHVFIMLPLLMVLYYVKYALYFAIQLEQQGMSFTQIFRGYLQRNLFTLKKLAFL